MKNEEERQDSDVCVSEGMDATTVRMPNDKGSRDTHMLQEDFSALSLRDDQADDDKSCSDSGCHNTKTGALAAECGAQASALIDFINEEVTQEAKWRHCCEAELSLMSTAELQSSLRKLRSRIEEVSAELVALLQERQRLRDEVPIRNVTIAQLLKVHEQLQMNFTEPLAIQMSVIFPDQNEALDCL